MIKILLFLLLATPCLADDGVTVFIGQWSRHWNEAEPKYNSKHDLLGIEYNNYGLLHFVNSYYQPTTGIYKRYNLGLNFGVKGVLLKGYQGYQGNGVLLPAVVFDYRVYYNNFGLELNTVPGMVTSIGFTYKW